MRFWPGGLALGRSLGDSDCGDFVSPLPAVQILHLPPRGATLIMCSDGVWDAIDKFEVTGLVRVTEKAETLASRIVAAALQSRGLRDDTTCVVVQLGWPVTSALRELRRGNSGKKELSSPEKNKEKDEWLGSRGVLMSPFPDDTEDLPEPYMQDPGCCELVLARLLGSEQYVQDTTTKGGKKYDVAFHGVGAPSFNRRANGSPHGAHAVDGCDPSEAVHPWAGDRIGNQDVYSPAKAPEKAKGAVSERGVGSDDEVPSIQLKEPPRSRPVPLGRKVHYSELGDGMKLLGSGEYCSVFATSVDGGQPVAVKMLRETQLTSTTAQRDFDFEMHLMSRMNHKHILRCIGTSHPGMPPNRMFLVLPNLLSTLAEALPPPPLPDGTSTFARLQMLKRWPVVRGLKLGFELAVALRYLHDECFDAYVLLHRDIKPKNLGIMADGRLVIFDFGISKLLRRTSSPDDVKGAVKMTGMCGSLRYVPCTSLRRLSG